jgi:hypothetical protein
MSIEGTGLSKPIALSAAGEKGLFGALLRQVSWMAGRAGDPMKPDPATLGPKYTLTLLADRAPLQVYDLYPAAPGGPRAYRPAAQPTATTSEAWFYVSMSIPELLRAAGVSTIQPGASSSAGALTYDDPAGYVPAVVDTTAPGLSIGDAIGQQGRTLLLWVGTALLVLLLIFPVALRSRRYSARQANR